MKIVHRNTRGSNLVEYSILAGLVSVVAVFSVVSMGDVVKDAFDETSVALSGHKAEGGVGGAGTGSAGNGGGGDNSGPPDPYADYYDPDTFLIGTSGADTLNITNTSYLGIMALESDDRLEAGPAGGILIGHKGDDSIYTSTGDDTVVFAAGDGSDFIRTGSGNDLLAFPNLNASDATFHAAGPDMEISWASGDKVVIDEFLWDRQYGFETFRFADGDFTYEQALVRAQEDDKATGTVRTSRGNDTLTHRASADPGYTITGYTDGADSLAFAETNFADIRITRQSQSHILFHDGADVLIQDYLFTRGWIENISFMDGPRTVEEIWQRSLEDSRATGTVNMSRHDDYFTHTNGVGDYYVTGNYNGTDELSFLDQSQATATFEKDSSNLIIWTDAGDRIRISSYLSSNDSIRGWLETIRFTDGVMTADDIQARIDSGG